ncbi:unnamed protein product [Effrenium voratum]|nr:unnamed protein product [Effrenium voratum]
MLWPCEELKSPSPELLRVSSPQRLRQAPRPVGYATGPTSPSWSCCSCEATRLGASRARSREQEVSASPSPSWRSRSALEERHDEAPAASSPSRQMPEPCTCCLAPEECRWESMPPLASAKTLGLAGDVEQVIRAPPGELATSLVNVFGSAGVKAIFGRSAEGARRLQCSGFNHVFMIELGGKLAKCIRPHGGAGGNFSEVLEAQRLRKVFPTMPQDPQVLFPDKAFLCKDRTGLLVCEVLVFEYLSNCQSVADLWRSFERTHPCGVRRCAAACAEHRADERDEVQCEHARALRALVRQAAQLARRFQETHGRRHGDLKADNVLVDRRGRLRVSDFLSPFCVACDREEFCSSIRSGHPLSQELQKAFEEEWHNSAEASKWTGSPVRLPLGLWERCPEVLGAVLNSAGVPSEKPGFAETCVIIDKLDKIGADEVKKELAKQVRFEAWDLAGRAPPSQVGLSSEVADTIVAATGAKTLEEFADIAGVGESEEVQELRRLFALAEDYGYADWLQFDASVVRGLAYYTGVVFEGFDRAGVLRAVCGGGRYDKLLELYGSKKEVPCVGFGFGDCAARKLTRSGQLKTRVIMELLKERNALASERFSRQASPSRHRTPDLRTTCGQL